MKSEDIKARYRLICDIERLRSYAAMPVFYNSDYSGGTGLFPYSESNMPRAVPGMLQDMEAVGKRAIERELGRLLREAERLGVEL